MRIERLPGMWRVWLATRDYVFGTYLLLHDDGRVFNVTDRVDEGEERFAVRPSDRWIAERQRDD